MIRDKNRYVRKRMLKEAIISNEIERENRVIVVENYEKILRKIWRNKYKGDILDLLKQFHEELFLGTNGYLVEVGKWRSKNVYILKRDLTKINLPKPTELRGLLNEFRNFFYLLGEITVEKIAETHWRLERIHPFLDGNGRVGRLLIWWQTHTQLKNSNDYSFWTLSRKVKQNLEQYYNAFDDNTPQKMIELFTKKIITKRKKDDIINTKESEQQKDNGN